MSFFSFGLGGLSQTKDIKASAINQHKAICPILIPIAISLMYTMSRGTSTPMINMHPERSAAKHLCRFTARKNNNVHSLKVEGDTSDVVGLLKGVCLRKITKRELSLETES